MAYSFKILLHRSVSFAHKSSSIKKLINFILLLIFLFRKVRNFTKRSRVHFSDTHIYFIFLARLKKSEKKCIITTYSVDTSSSQTIMNKGLQNSVQLHYIFNKCIRFPPESKNSGLKSTCAYNRCKDDQNIISCLFTNLNQ